MLPNINRPFGKDGPDEVVFMCNVGCDDYLRIYIEKSGIDDGQLNFLVSTDHPVSLWAVLRSWWKYRRAYWHDIELSRSDVVALKEAIEKWLALNETETYTHTCVCTCGNRLDNGI